MKIGEFWKIQSVEGGTETKKSGAAGKDDDFSALLQDELSSAEATDSAGKLEEIRSAPSIAGIFGSHDDEQLSGLLNEIDGIISKLQSFETALKSDASPKQVDKIVNEVGELTRQLQTKLSGVSDYQGLDDLTQEVNVAGYMESVKWRRGDYL